jgi:hypothetical protein
LPEDLRDDEELAGADGLYEGPEECEPPQVGVPYERDGGEYEGEVRWGCQLVLGDPLFGRGEVCGRHASGRVAGARQAGASGRPAAGRPAGGLPGR